MGIPSCFVLYANATVSASAVDEAVAPCFLTDQEIGHRLPEDGENNSTNDSEVLLVSSLSPHQSASDHKGNSTSLRSEGLNSAINDIGPADSK